MNLMNNHPTLKVSNILLLTFGERLKLSIRRRVALISLALPYAMLFVAVGDRIRMQFCAKMQAKVYWTKEKYPGRIAIVPRPRGGDWLEDEAAVWREGDLNVIVSLLEADEIEAFELTREAEFCETNDISFFSFPIADRRVPVSKHALVKLLNKLKLLLVNGENIGIHCRQSIGRSALLAAALMILFGISPDDAFRQLSEVRGLEVPETDEQRDWIKKLAEELAVQSV